MLLLTKLPLAPQGPSTHAPRKTGPNLVRNSRLGLAVAGQGNFGPDLLPMAQQIWWTDAVGDEALEAAGGRERSAQAVRGEPQPGQRDASGCHPPKNVRPDRAREIVGYLQASYQVSERRVCGAFPINRSTQRYQSRRLDQAGLKMKIKELAATRVHYGYRRIHVLLRREGWEINHKRTHRLYLQLRNKTPKRKVKAKLRDDRAAASHDRAKHRWR